MQAREAEHEAKLREIQEEERRLRKEKLEREK